VTLVIQRIVKVCKI